MGRSRERERERRERSERRRERERARRERSGKRRGGPGVNAFEQHVLLALLLIAALGVVQRRVSPRRLHPTRVMCRVAHDSCERRKKREKQGRVRAQRHPIISKASVRG